MSKETLEKVIKFKVQYFKMATGYIINEHEQHKVPLPNYIISTIQTDTINLILLAELISKLILKTIISKQYY